MKLKYEQLLKNNLPKKLKVKLTDYCTKWMKENHTQKFLRREKEISAYELSFRHLENLVAVPNRIELLRKLPRGGVVAEIGVDTGRFSEKILSENEPSKLHLIDVWNSERYGLNKKNEVEKKFKDHINSKRVQINFGYSTEAVSNFEDDYFDWIYIDTDHSYGTTIKELNLYASKIKKGGIIAGHDYVEGYWNGLVKFGVIEAVHEFCVLQNWEFVYLTMENREHRSFAIRKI